MHTVSYKFTLRKLLKHLELDKDERVLRAVVFTLLYVVVVVKTPPPAPIAAATASLGLYYLSTVNGSKFFQATFTYEQVDAWLNAF